MIRHEELHKWHMENCDTHLPFRRLDETVLKDDPCVKAMSTETEESKKVERNKGAKQSAVYKRLDASNVPKININNLFGEEESEEKSANE
eukprot:scaffold713_cov131-Cylindrotheca_fusiformis.AAC.6